MARKYLIPGLFSAVAMFAISCLWHGVVLNDFTRINYPMPLFLGFLALLYVALSMVMTLAIHYIPSPRSFYTRGLLIGAVTGGIVFLVTFVLGTSFSNNYKPIFAIMDFVWQSLEQAGGAFVASYFIDLAIKREKFFAQ